jgi:hypothetical protein
MRIKKKEAVLPFRETLAYRMILIAGSVAVFLVALFTLVRAFTTSIPVAGVSGVVAAGAAFGIFHNLDRLRMVKIPKQTLSRMKRR